jgi:hypothetical protein
MLHHCGKHGHAGEADAPRVRQSISIAADDIWEHVLGYVTDDCLWTASLVCKTWASLSQWWVARELGPTCAPKDYSPANTGDPGGEATTTVSPLDP